MLKQEKIKTILKKYLRRKKSFLLIHNDRNVRYLTGFTGSYSFILMHNDCSLMFVDYRYKERAIDEVYDIEVRSTSNPFQDLIRYIKENDLKYGYFDGQGFTASEYISLLKKTDRVILQDISRDLLKIRALKGEDEVYRIRRASILNLKAFENLFKKINPSVSTELDLKNILTEEMKKLGSDDPFFPVIVTSGLRTALPHSKSLKVPIKNKNLLLFDFGCVYDGYTTDETLVVFLGKPLREIMDVFNLVKEAKDRAVERVKIGIRASLIDRYVRDFFRKKGMLKFFLHGLGHGVGLDIHEQPNLSQRSTDILEEGMVFTIEPGLYFSGRFGIRLEDVYLLSKNGPAPLTLIEKSKPIVL